MATTITLDSVAHTDNQRRGEVKPALCIDQLSQGRRSASTIRLLDTQGRLLGQIRYQPKADSPFILTWEGNIAISGATPVVKPVVVMAGASTQSQVNESGSTPVSSNDSKIAGAGLSTNPKKGCGTCGGRRKLGV